MPEQRRLLVSRDPCDRHGRAEQRRLADRLGRCHDAWQQRPLDAEQREELVVPVERVQGGEHRARRVRRVGDVHGAVRQPPDEPAVDGAECERLLRQLRAGEKPLELRRREVRVGNEPCPLANEAIGKLAATLGGPSVLPDDRPLHGDSAPALPDERRLALVRDADPRELARRDARLRERGLRRGERARPDLLRVVLDPAGTREELLDLPVAAPERPELGIDDETGDPGRSRVDREDHGQRVEVFAALDMLAILKALAQVRRQGETGGAGLQRRLLSAASGITAGAKSAGSDPRLRRGRSLKAPAVAVATAFLDYWADNVRRRKPPWCS